MDTLKCKHNVSANDKRYTGVWAAPFSQCVCCGIHFPYIDSAWYMGDREGGRSWTKDLCAECGGHYVKWGEDA